jgi:hypothetical protein
MAKEYLEKLTAFMDELSSDLPDDTGVECRHFFSGAAVYADGRICISLTPVGLAMKLPEGTRERLLATEKAIPLRYFPKAPVKKDYVLFPDYDAQSTRLLRGHLKESIAYALTLPKPKPKRKK